MLNKFLAIILVPSIDDDNGLLRSSALKIAESKRDCVAWLVIANWQEI
jgi:hypothetical protein